MNTPGITSGHSSGADAFAVAATPAIGPFPNPFNSANVVETFSSDGPRRMFFQGDGTLFTPGDLSATGGIVRQKPDITAADGAAVTGAGGFGIQFFGTSAAAPHAAAIAGLLKSANPALTPAQIRTALTSTAIDIEAAGVDRDSGVGIVMADAAVASIGVVAGAANLTLGTATVTDVGGNTNGFIEPGERATLDIPLLNSGINPATSVTATLSTTTPGVVITPSATRGYPDIPATSGTSTNATPFEFVLQQGATYGTNIDFVLTVDYNGTIRTFPFTIPTGQLTNISGVLDTTANAAGSNYTAATGTQTGRLNFTFPVSTCGSTKTNPGPTSALLRRYDAYTFTNTSASPICATIVLTHSANALIHAVAYLPTFTPATPAVGYAGDGGGSTTSGAGTAQLFSITVPATSTFTVVVSESNQNGALGVAYNLRVTGLPAAAVPANQPPVNTVPGAQITNEDTALVFTGATAISTSDPDAGGNSVKATLTATNGSFSLGGTTGLTFSPVGAGNDGTNDTQMIFTGSIANINTALNNLSFSPTPNYNGPANLQIKVEDQNFTGTGGNQIDTDDIAITVNAVNDVPSFTKGADQTVLEDSAQTVPRWATAISAGPANESGQALTFLIQNNTNPGLFSTGPAISSTGTLTYTPATNASGSATITTALMDNGGGADTSASQTFVINVTAVNDVPSFTKGPDQTVLEDSGAQSVPSWATAISAGPADESGQALTFLVQNNSNPGFFSAGPAISSTGTLTYTPAANASGSATITIALKDNGGGTDTSASQTFVINLTAVNDVPSFTKGPNQTVPEDAGAQSVSGWATSISPGAPDELGQTLTFLIQNNTNPSLFSAGPAISSIGTLTYTPAANASGSATITIALKDNGGGTDTSPSQTFGITVTDVNDAPATVNETLPNIAEDSGPRLIGAGTLVGNDSKGGPDENGQILTIKTVSNAEGGTVAIVDGDVVFTPAANYSGPAIFSYTVEDNGTTNGSPDPKTSGPAVVQFNITEVNDAPTAVNDALSSVAEDSGQRTIPASVLTANDSKGPANESGQTLIIKTVGNAVGGTVSIVAGNVVFTPTANYTGPSSFDYTVEDNGTTNGVAAPLTSPAATASFSTTAVADTPSVTDATANANTQSTLGLVISRNPADGAEVTHFKITGITAGTLFKNNGTTVINNGDFITFAEGNAGLKFTPGVVNGSFQVQASTSASDAGLGGDTVQATIVINPLGGVIRFSSANYGVAEAAGFRTITVERSGDTSQAVTVDYASSDHSGTADSAPCTSPGAGFASSRCDFTTALGTLRFAAGETSKTFNVLITNDNYVEGPETLDLTLSSPTNGAVFGVPQTAVLQITDDVSEPTTNPINNSADFVRAQYHDILGREPDAAGLAFWTDNIEKCADPARRPAGLTVEQCVDKQRESTAVAFFQSPEFQMTGGYVYHLYKGSLSGAPNYDGGSPGSSVGRFPTFLEFMRDISAVSEGILVGGAISGAVVEANRNALAAAFVERPEFVAKYGGLDSTLYVQELFNTTGIAATAAQKQALVDGLNNASETRASVLRKVVDGTVVINESNVQFTTTYGQAFINQENNRLFVFLEYIGYLRRNPDQAGFVFWLGKLNQFNGDPVQAEMVKSFILSPEYRSRFGQP
ncbi:MAG TPA: tandem-95 repeat protein [Pyrinomonadaceae bacterium]|nr:tandem-95 repeat protein [Pyrinomonadaceae bacterium]